MKKRENVNAKKEKNPEIRKEKNQENNSIVKIKGVNKGGVNPD